MSPKSKTQKRNEQRRKNNNNKSQAGEHSKASNQQQQAMHAMKKQMDDMQAKVRAFDSMKATYMAKFGPAAASDPPKVDEKYMKEPTPVEKQLTALVKACEAGESMKSIKSGIVAATKMLSEKESVSELGPKVEHPDLKTLLRDPFIMAQFKQMMHSVTHNGNLHFGGRRSHYGGRLNNLRTRLAINATINGSSGTAISTVINVRPAAFSEFSSFQALFDEFKVHGGVLHFNYWATGQTNLVVGNDAAIAYDPVDNSAYASVAGVLVASTHIGPICGVGVTDASLASTAARTAAPTCTSKHGFFNLPFKCPGGPQQVPNNSQQVMTGLWCDTNISSSLGDYGYLKPYFTSAGSTTTTVSYYLILDVEFRNRT